MSLIKLPGLIDVHVHLRDPGQTYKEDFYSATCAALAGGFTTILDMPNNKVPVTSLDSVKQKIEIAMKKIVCDVGFFFGSLGNNSEEFNKVKNSVFGLKLYLNMTTGNYLIEKVKIPDVFKNWRFKTPILLHSEGELIDEMIEYAKLYMKRIHICHISKQIELEQIIKAKKRGIKITCGVTPHHLFLSKKDEKRLGAFGIMKPPLQSQKDLDYLWKNISDIDIVESDHAPHTIGEKNSNNPPFGVPGLETTLPLLLTAVNNKILTMDRLIKLCYKNPKKIFNIKTDKNTWVEVDSQEEYIIDNKDLKTKCGWSPFDGWKVKGKVKRVVIRGNTVFYEGRILVKRGSGNIIKPKNK